MKRWVKIPGPGQFRGEGEWKDFDLEWEASSTMLKLGAMSGTEYWNWLVDTKFLPTIEGDKPDES